MLSKSSLEGWERYPENLSESGFNGHEYNFSSYRQQLSHDSKRLFVPQSEKINIKIIDFASSVSERIIERESTLEDHLRVMNPLPDAMINLLRACYCRAWMLTTSVFQSSWGRLVINESSTRKLLTAFNVFPPFVEILRSFGQRTGFEDDSAGGIYLRNDGKHSVHEACYLAKQVEEHGRKEEDGVDVDPWSIRKMGVYHKSSSSSGDTFIILNPSVTFRRRLTCMREHGGQISPQALHEMILSCSMENWRWYISDLEKRYFKMATKAQLTQMDEKGDPILPAANIGIADTQGIQVLQDKCEQLAHALELDCQVLQELQRQFTHLPTGDGSDGPADLNYLLSLSGEAGVQVKRVDRLLKRLDGTIALTRTILDFRCLASLQHNSHVMTDISTLSRDENVIMLDLTRKAARDTDIMKWITFLTLVYLPASFAAVSCLPRALTAEFLS
ncbi:hypothetical protein NA57DRAFT_74969 [Rhizodiscina lignyota]|uniref:CorA-like transporter domain-containing protein n=1 Tax=Rhizodiscina lignyota TaxID=1504668 RepID=A0A9P4IHT9_9PEZI|nr:hypothetical protein NA57DRAFT_74969 [Rhizodiscina lignyota]